MSNLHWITLNSRLQQGISLINNLNNKKLELLLTHIINSETDDFFTADELQKLQDTLKLKDSELQLLLQSISYIFKQSSKVIVKPTDLQKQLLEDLSFDQEKAEIFVKEWSKQTKTDLEDFENRDKLDDITWEVNLQAGLDLGSEQAIPSARIELDLSKVNDSSKHDKVIMELGEEDLQQLYNTLEVIQLRLDNISKRE